MNTKKKFEMNRINIEQFKYDAIRDVEQERVKNNSRVNMDVPFDFLENEASTWEEYREGYYFYKRQYEAIRDASFWKMTKPLRDFSDWVRWLRTGEKREYHPIEISPSISQREKTQIGVHLHLYYEDLLDEFCTYLNNIPEDFDLYISCRETADMGEIKERAKKILHVKKVVVKKGKNRGRDIAPFYVLFGKELLNYEILLHVHSKKSLYTGSEKKEWRQWALDGVLKNENMVRNALEIMRDKKTSTGLVFGEMTPMLPPMALHWLYNSGRGREILHRLHLNFENHMLFYPVGSFFWAKTSAIRPLFELDFTYDSFDEENGQIDGTLAHALERVIAEVVRGRGYNMQIFDPETEQFSVNKSYKSFRDYFSYDIQKLSDRLICDHDIVSFDIFDTLISRCIYEPDDLFNLMARIIKSRYSVDLDYLQIRKKAEEIAWKEQGDFCNIHHIYSKLPEVSPFTEDIAEELKALEIGLELELCIPRKDMLEVFNNVKAAGKKIYLISDMYLTSEIIEKMLNKCGYSGYTELWVSCEKGKRKDRNTMWDLFFEKFDSYRTIHVGDNPHSDIQIVGDRRKENFLVLSPVEQFRLSVQYEKYQKCIDGSVENSLTLGYLVNKCLYNSPFALKANGISRIESVEDVVEGIFGPIFLKYIDYLHNSSRNDAVLLFLSREGYFLQKLYKHYCRVFGKKELENVYFLTSRRATSVAQIGKYIDAKELLTTEYSGKLSNLLIERFGLENIVLSTDVDVHLPKMMEQVIPVVGEYAEQILTTAKVEKENYLRYMQELLGTDFDWKRATLVDVGYAGTIQYYLMKILNVELDACYLATGFNMKPGKLDGTYRSVYNFWQSKMFEDTQLFLEAITAAPHGQVVKFVEIDGKIEPVLKTESAEYGEKAEKMQRYIYQYFEKMAHWTKEIHPRFSKELGELIFSEILRVNILGKESHGLFNVNDQYCMNGSWVYDEETNDWKIKRESEEIYLKTIRKM